ncbi:MAG: hypothetical protein MR890_09640 [Akkermansia muciniphila]|nr:hypothetical protein [Akkermansia muciniphila]
MRLHLPKGLLAALLGAVCTTAVMAAENKEFTGDWTVTEATEVAQLKVNTGNAKITMTGDGAITAASFLRFSSWSTDSLTIQGGSLNITGEAKTDANYQQTLDLINTKISLGQGLNFMTWGSANPSAVNVNGSEVSLGGTIRATVGSAQLNFVTANSTIDVSGLTAAAYGSLVTPTAGTNGFCSSNFRYTLADSTVSTTIAEGVTVTVKNGTETIGTLTSADNGQGLYFIKTGTNTTYYIGNENVTWTDATGATALWVAENLTVEGGSSVPSTVTEFDVSAGSTLSMASLSGTKTVNGEGKLSVGTLSDTTAISGSGHIDITGDISLSGKSLTLKNSAEGSMVTLYGTNTLRMIDMKTDNITAHLTLAAGSSTTLDYPTGTGIGLWMAANSTLDILKKDDGVSKEGGKLTFSTNTTSATISATDQDSSISSTGAAYTFDSGNFTLTNAEFRANATSAAITLKNKLLNAVVVNDSTNDLTIENAVNTLRGVDASGGNIKFAANAEITGSIKIADGKSVIVNSGAVLTHDGFTYDGSTIKTADSARDLSLVNNAVITGGTLTQTANISETVTYKVIQSSLTDVKLVNTTGLELHLESDASLSAVDIGGKLQVGANTTVSGNTTVTGTVEVLADKSLQMRGAANITGTADVEGTLSAGANSTISTLTGSGTLKASGGSTVSATNSSGFSGTLEASGTDTALNATGGLGSSLKAAKAIDGAAILLQGNQDTSTIRVEEVVIAGAASITAFNEILHPIEVKAEKVQIGAGGGSLVGNLSISNGGTLTLDASAGTEGAGLATTGSITLGSSLT